MITPRLFRRSLRQALQWRFLLLWLALVGVPAAVALAPLSARLHGILDHSSRAKELVAALDSHAIVDLLKQTREPGFGPSLGAGGALATLLAILLMPFGAGAALAMARSEEPLRFGTLLAGAGENYGRMLRMLAVAILPLGVAAVAAGALMKGISKFEQRALLESQAMRATRLSMAAIALVFFVAQLTLDAGRAHFAAEPHRRSAFLAWWSGVRLLVRLPLRVLGFGLGTALTGAGLSAAFLLLRLRIQQAGPLTVLVAFLLAELAVASVGWDRAARLVGLAELVRADAAERLRAFDRTPVRISPPPEPAPTLQTQSATLDPLGPPSAAVEPEKS